MLVFLVLLFIWGFTVLEGICCWDAYLPLSRDPPPAIASPGSVFRVVWHSRGPSSNFCALSFLCPHGLWKQSCWHILAVLFVTLLLKIVSIVKKQFSFRNMETIIVIGWKSTWLLLKSGQGELCFEAENSLWGSGFPCQRTKFYTEQFFSLKTQAGRW